MKNRVLPLLLAFVLLLSLCACGAGKKDEASADLTAFSETLFTGEDAPAMMPLDESILALLYPGLEGIERVQTVGYTAAISAVACEVLMVEVASAEDVTAVEEILRQRIDYQIEQGAFYPATVLVWQESAEIVTQGRYVALFVGEQMADTIAAYEALFQ